MNKYVLQPLKKRTWAKNLIFQARNSIAHLMLAQFFSPTRTRYVLSVDLSSYFIYLLSVCAHKLAARYFGDYYALAFISWVIFPLNLLIIFSNVISCTSKSQLLISIDDIKKCGWKKTKRAGGMRNDKSSFFAVGTLSYRCRVNYDYDVVFLLEKKEPRSTVWIEY